MKLFMSKREREDRRHIADTRRTEAEEAASIARLAPEDRIHLSLKLRLIKTWRPA